MHFPVAAASSSGARSTIQANAVVGRADSEWARNGIAAVALQAAGETAAPVVDGIAASD